MSPPRQRPGPDPEAPAQRETGFTTRRATALVASLLAGAGVLAICASLVVANGGEQPRGPVHNEATPHQQVPRTRTPTTPPGTAPPTPPAAAAYGAETEPNITMSHNPINAPTLTARSHDCALPPFDTSSAGQQAFYQASLSCLNTTWEPVLRAANLPFYPANVVTVTDRVTTPCGSREPTQTALYCNGTLYMTSAYYRDIEHHGNDAGVYFGQIAHEYGHHVQEIAGIMDASWRKRGIDGARSPAAHETSRRLELQATCYGGMFLASVRDNGAAPAPLLDQALNDSGKRGDYGNGPPRTHGTPESNEAWVHQGYEKNRTYQCNTWLADPETVS